YYLLAITSMHNFFILSKLHFSPVCFLLLPLHPRSTLFPYTTLFRSLLGGPSRRSQTSSSGCLPPYQESESSGHQCSQPQTHTSRSEEHTSELQSRFDIVCRLLLKKKRLIYLNHQLS